MNAGKRQLAQLESLVQPDKCGWASTINEAALKQIIEELPVWVQVSRLDGTIELSNRAATLISGYDPSEIVGRSWPYPWFASPWAGPDDEPYAQLCRAGYVPEFETVCITREGQSRTLGVTLSLLRDTAGQPARALILARDLSEQKRLEAAAVQAQKIQAVSQLASGVAHDINNNLAVIFGYSELLLTKASALDTSAREALDAILKQAMECAETVRRIQLFSRPVPQSQFTPFSLNDLVQHAIQQNQSLWREYARTAGIDIRVETDLEPVPPVRAHLPGLKEALTNLISNAVDAVPEGGVISFRTRLRGDAVELEIADTGVGIDPMYLDRIFDPFFTTKGPASSGLGLSIAYNLITQQAGAISVASQPGQGSTFTIRLPVSPEHAASGRSPANNHKLDQWRLEVLVVDDEPLVTEMLQALLESAGHRVSAFLGGAEAVAALQKSDFDLALVDLGMPGMDGWEVTRWINRLRPALPVIVATGWNVSKEDGHDHACRVSAVLRKPFGGRELNEAIKQAIGREE